MGILDAALGLETFSADKPTGDYSAQVLPPARTVSGTVTPLKAMTLTSVFRAVQITAGMGADLTIDAWRGRDLVTPVPAIVANPDPWRSLSSWIERIIVGLALDGNAFLLKIRADDTDQASPVVAAPVLDPGRVRIYRDAQGRKRYSYTTERGDIRDYSGAEIIHLWNLEVPGLDRSLGPIGHARASLAGHLDTRDYGAGWFNSGDVPTGILTTDQHLEPEAAAEYKRRWLESDASVKVLGKGLKYAATILDPEDAQWIEAQKFGVQDVARLFGVPAAYLLAAVEGSSLTYANLETVDAQFLRTTLFPVYLRKITNALTELLPRGQVARFDLSALLRPEAKTRAEIYKIYVDTKVLHADEVRDLERFGPRKETA